MRAMKEKALEEKDNYSNDREESDDLCDDANGNDDHYDDIFEIKIENVDPRSPDEENALTDKFDGNHMDYASDQKDDELKRGEQTINGRIEDGFDEEIKKDEQLHDAKEFDPVWSDSETEQSSSRMSLRKKKECIPNKEKKGCKKTKTSSSNKSTKSAEIERPFSCSFCDKTYKTFSSLNVHIKTQNSTKSIKSTKKKKKHQKKRKPQLSDRDLELTSETEKPYICSLCDKTYKTQNALVVHMRIHTGESLQPYLHKCHLCPKMYVKTSTLRKHFRRHHGDSTIKPFKCLLCDESFNRHCECKKHLATHKDYRPFKCDECGKAFGSKAGLIRHVTSLHTFKPFSCESCDKSFFHEEQLNIHRKVNCPQNFICNICKKVLLSKESFNRHRLIHSGVKDFQCEYCDKRFSEIASLRRHVFSLHTAEKPFFMCEYCSARFSYKHKLKSHIKVKHTCKGLTLYLCEICGKNFNCSSHLALHRRVHSGERPYKCETCGKTFKQDAHLRRHKIIHTGMKPFSCEFCGKTFNQITNLKTHVKTHTRSNCKETPIAT
uniref:Zinc finger protein 93-like n=1 Tax=Crassostrea virginica TaxID=6565 RepID=A0A8B8BR40_CRAVI|nr:zinc finger protein 93-like [Crassostrea virginica]